MCVVFVCVSVCVIDHVCIFDPCELHMDLSNELCPYGQLSGCLAWQKL